MEHVVAFMIGTSAVIIGLSLIFRPAEWLSYLKHIRMQGASASLIIGYLHLIMGTFIVGFHWMWTGLPLLLTLVGIKAIIEGITYTLWPNFLITMLAWYEPHYRTWFRTGGIITIIIGLLFLSEWKNYMWPDCTWQSCLSQAPKR